MAFDTNGTDSVINDIEMNQGFSIGKACTFAAAFLSGMGFGVYFIFEAIGPAHPLKNIYFIEFMILLSLGSLVLFWTNYKDVHVRIKVMAFSPYLIFLLLYLFGIVRRQLF